MQLNGGLWTMRVKIGNQLENRISRVYKPAGYSRKGDLVREATRQLVTELEAEYLAQDQSAHDAFSCTIHRGGVGGPVIRLQPTSSLRFKYFSKGNPPHTTILDTGLTYIPEKSPSGSDYPGVRDTLESLEGVEKANVLTKGEISVTVEEDSAVPVDNSEEETTIVDQIYDELDRLIAEANRRVHDGEETRDDALRRAVKDYWKYADQIGQ